MKSSWLKIYCTLLVDSRLSETR